MKAQEMKDMELDMVAGGTSIEDIIKNIKPVPMPGPVFPIKPVPNPFTQPIYPVEPMPTPFPYIIKDK